MRHPVALRKESVDRNSAVDEGVDTIVRSLSARRAWIEIKSKLFKIRAWAVALRKESVDRNAGLVHLGRLAGVALRKESVDRNHGPVQQLEGNQQSLSARRAWIEIAVVRFLRTLGRSLSARRAWIEMDWASVITAMTSRRSPQGERG